MEHSGLCRAQKAIVGSFGTYPGYTGAWWPGTALPSEVNVQKKGSKTDGFPWENDFDMMDSRICQIYGSLLEGSW